MRNLVTALLVFCGCAAAADNAAIAIRNAKIVTVSGSVITKGTVVVRNGLIQDVGENVQVPADAILIDGEGLTIYPGLVDALSTWGMPGVAARGRGAAAAPAVATTPAAPPSHGPEDPPVGSRPRTKFSRATNASRRPAAPDLRPPRFGRRVDFSPVKARWSIYCRAKRRVRWCWFRRWDSTFR
jgi:hypothetical protein